ncbi:MAG: alpha/beta hydrolase [Idiomarina sp.]|nr:alpha/beta hydrolase [Idiomarina sp.]
MRILSFVVLTLILALALAACQPTRVLNTVTPSGSYDRVKDIAYGADARQKFDLYLPTSTDQRPAVVVFVYGGAWDQGSKDQFEFVGQAFARLGYTTVIPNYRLYPDVEFPAFIDDVASAISAFPEHLHEDCPSGREIILVGHSAGAHTAALLLADTQYFERHRVNPSHIKAFIGMSGPYDLPLEHERVKEKFSQVEGDEANPVALAHGDMPVTLLIHGESDTIAKPEHSEKFQARLEALGVQVTSHYYRRTRHADVVASLASPLRFWTPAYDDIQTFLVQEGFASQRCEPL